MTAKPLACPSCAARFDLRERFCGSCGMPLVYVGADAAVPPASDAHARARKIDPNLAEGELVRVAGGRHQAEAEMIQGMLLEEGVPSVLRRSPGFDVPDFLAAGPRDVMVPEGGYEAARGVLLQADMAPQEAPGPIEGGFGGRAVRLVAVIAGASVVAALLAWGLVQLFT